MEIQQIRAFLAVAEELHFGRAALRLHMAQPPLSRSIQRLEHELNAQLFIRGTRTVQLTAEGEALLAPARDILEACRRSSLAVAAAGRGETGRVRVAFAGMSSHVMVGKLAKRVRETHPGIDFELSSSNFALPAMDTVLGGSMEVGLGRWNFIPAVLDSRVVAIERLVVALHESHPLSGQSSLWMSQLANQPFVTLPEHPGAILHDHLRRLSSAAGFAAEIIQVAPDSMTLMALVAADIGVALTVSSVPDNFSHPGVTFVPLADPIEAIELRLVWRKDNTSPALREVLRISEDVLPSPGLAVP